MVVQHEVDVAHIEAELESIWQQLESPDKVKAALFNLIVHIPDREHAAYVERVTQGILKKYPSRVIFLVEDPDAKKDLVHTQVALAEIASDPVPVACDQIQVLFSPSQRGRIPFILLPHLLPDLPVYLLWIGDPTGQKNLYEDVERWISRVIFDPDTLTALPAHGRAIQGLFNRYDGFVSDLNWTLIEGWRAAFASLFDSPEHLEQLGRPRRVRVLCSGKPSEFARDAAVPAFYLVSWLAAMVGWKIETVARENHGLFLALEQGEVTIEVEERPNLPFGTILDVEILSDEGYGYRLEMEDDPKFARIHRYDPQMCDLPYTYFTGRTGRTRALMREMFKEGTSTHFRKTIDLIAELEL